MIWQNHVRMGDSATCKNDEKIRMKRSLNKERQKRKEKEKIEGNEMCDNNDCKFLVPTVLFVFNNIFILFMIIFAAEYGSFI